jgi:hypothetical protein
VALAALGQCDTDEDGRKRQLSAREVAVARRQALSVVMRAMLIAAIAAAIAWAV